MHVFAVQRRIRYCFRCINCDRLYDFLGLVGQLFNQSWWDGHVSDALVLPPDLRRPLHLCVGGDGLLSNRNLCRALVLIRIQGL